MNHVGREFELPHVLLVIDDPGDLGRVKSIFIDQSGPAATRAATAGRVGKGAPGRARSPTLHNSSGKDDKQIGSYPPAISSCNGCGAFCRHAKCSSERTAAAGCFRPGADVQGTKKERRSFFVCERDWSACAWPRQFRPRRLYSPRCDGQELQFCRAVAVAQPTALAMSSGKRARLSGSLKQRNDRCELMHN